MEIKLINENSVIIYFGEKIDLNISKEIKIFYKNLFKLEGIIDVVCSYTSVLLVYDIFIYNQKTIVEELEKYIKILPKELDEKSENIIEIPTYYGVEVGLDLENISQKLNLSIEEIVKIHTSRIYDVFAIGFLPAFAYLGEVDEKIVVNRLDNPRKVVKKGSVAIANKQTAIYPQNSPGGWNIIGKTALNIYDKSIENFSLINYSNKVKFKEISKNEFLDMGGIL